MADNIGNKAAHDYHLDTAPTRGWSGSIWSSRRWPPMWMC